MILRSVFKYDSEVVPPAETNAQASMSSTPAAAGSAEAPSIGWDTHKVMMPLHATLNLDSGLFLELACAARGMFAGCDCSIFCPNRDSTTVVQYYITLIVYLVSGYSIYRSITGTDIVTKPLSNVDRLV